MTSRPLLVSVLCSATATLALGACTAVSSAGDGDAQMQGDGDLVAGDGDLPVGDGDLPVGDGDFGLGDGDLPVGDGDMPGDGDGPVSTEISLGAHTGACGRLPVTFRDFQGNGEPRAHPDFEISALYPAGGGWSGSGEYGDPPGSQAYMGVNEAGCDMIASTLTADGKPTFNHGLGGMRVLNPADRSPGVAQSVVSCGMPGTWDWG